MCAITPTSTEPSDSIKDGNASKVVGYGVATKWNRLGSTPKPTERIPTPSPNPSDKTEQSDSDLEQAWGMRDLRWGGQSPQAGATPVRSPQAGAAPVRRKAETDPRGLVRRKQSSSQSPTAGSPRRTRRSYRAVACSPLAGCPAASSPGHEPLPVKQTLRHRPPTPKASAFSKKARRARHIPIAPTEL